MVGRDIIDTALEIASRKGTDSIPGKLAEKNYEELIQEWLDKSVNRTVRLEGLIASDTAAWHPLPGFLRAIFISVGGDPIGPVPGDHILYNETNFPANVKGYVIRDNKITFTGSPGDIGAGNAWVAYYHANNLAPSVTAELDIPDKLNMMLARELSYRFREDFGDRDSVLLGGEIVRRRRDKQNFLRLASGGTSEQDKPLQTDSFWRK